VSGNPFLGPQPYRAQDRARFFGRGEATRKLANRVLTHACVTVFGPSGAGKSSLMQAGVIPLLEDVHDFRVVHIEGWLKDEVPLERLVQAMFERLNLQQSPRGLSSSQRLTLAVELADLQSDRPLLLYLDQFEQLFQSGRDTERTREFLDCLQELARRSLRGLHLVLVLREDYLGLFQEHARGRREILEQGFRLRPLTVGEMTEVALQLSATGISARPWSRSELRELMLQVRATGQDRTDSAEVQTAFAQIVCRALWEKWAQEETTGPVRAESLLHEYLEKRLEEFGQLKEHARRLLEEHLVDSQGNRMLLLKEQAHEALAGVPQAQADKMLSDLTEAAMLHAERHQGSLYFEIGHDWLARKVFDRRQERAHPQHARSRWKSMPAIAMGAIGLVLLLGFLLLWALMRLADAEQALTRARDHDSLARAREQVGHARWELAASLLLEVSHPEQTRGWQELALEVLARGAPVVALRCNGEAAMASFSSDGQRVIVVCADKTVRVWKADGTGDPVVLRGHQARITSAAFSPDGLYVVTASVDQTVRVWKANTGEPVALLQGHAGGVNSAAFSPDGLYVVTASVDQTARVWKANTGEPVALLQGHAGGVNSAAFSPDGLRVVTGSDDNTAWVWEANTGARVARLHGPEAHVTSVAFSPDSLRVLTGPDDNTARVWKADGSGQPAVLRRHERNITSATFSLDGQHVVTASEDKTARVWSADGSEEPIVLRGHMARVTSVAFSPDGQRVVTASEDKTARVWSADGSGEPLVLRGHEARVTSAAFSPDGMRVVTASDDKTARIWLASSLSAIQRALLESHQSCPSPHERQTYLDESEPQARERYEACERSHGRLPPSTAGP
jgi:Tol biopolymer transport system component